MAPRKDYTFHTFLLSATVIGLLLLMGLIPSFEIFGLRVKRINILSDIHSFARDKMEDDSLKEYSDTTFQAESISALQPDAIEAAQSTPVGTSQSWDISPQGIIATPQTARTPVSESYSAPASPQAVIEPQEYGAPATLIEDFAQVMAGFYDALRDGNPRRPVRIAVLGDSFIEADIITADVREQLQLLFGGQGVGFVPFSSPLAKFRSTVKHTFEGWESYNVIKKNNAPAWVKDKFFVSGLVCVPSEGAWSRIEGADFRQRAARSSVARLFFINERSSTIEVVVNDTVQSSFTPEPDPLVQQINLYGDISSIKVRVNSPAGFTGYGVVLESPRGVAVDNYSVRSNSGMALFGTNAAINAQIGKLLGYDLIILQYGLNAMSPDILNYNSYSAQLVRIINYVRDCFPEAAVMVMSVGDRSTQKAGEYVTMPAVRAMIAAQRKAAMESGAAFWNTFQAMGGERSMVKFVENRWASKDYTHIGYPGGKYIATQLVRSLLYGYRSHNGESLDTDSIAAPDYSMPSLPPAASSTGTSVPVAAPDSSLHDVPAPAPADAATADSLQIEAAVPDSTTANRTAEPSGALPATEKDTTAHE